MSTTRRPVTFNVNQHSSVVHQTADVEARMANADVVLLQEAVHFDAVAFAKGHKGWAAYQVRVGNNDGHANTAVLYRTSLGTVTDTVCVFVGSAKDTRRRFLTAVEFNGNEWYGAVHIFPKRDTRAIPAELEHIGAWVKSQAGKSIVLGLDKNQCSVEALEKATGLKWYGVDIDGFLTDLPCADVAAFKPGYSDHPGVHGVVTLPDVPKPPKPTKPKTVKPPHPIYLGPAAHTSAGSNMPLTRIVIHSTVSACKPGGAREIAAYFNTPASGGSAHYIVDPGEVVQDVYDNTIAWHAPPNANSIGIEMCDIPGPQPGDKPGTALYRAAKKVWRWNRPEQQQMLERTAKLTARLCAAYHVPPVFIGPRALRAGKHGVTTHNNVSRTWHQSDHWDPGFWPRRKFMRMVKAEYARLTQG